MSGFSSVLLDCRGLILVFLFNLCIFFIYF